MYEIKCPNCNVTLESKHKEDFLDALKAHCKANHGGIGVPDASWKAYIKQKVKKI